MKPLYGAHFRHPCTCTFPCLGGWLLIVCAVTLGCADDRPATPITRSGIIDANTQASLDSLDGVQVIDGSLLIGRPNAQPIDDPVRDLAPLRDLEVVTNHFFISRTDSLRSLAPLSKLRTVGGVLDITDNANISSLAPLRSVCEIGRGFVIRQNPRLRTLDGLQGLHALPRAYLDISYNDSLTQLVGLDSLESQSASPIVASQSISISYNRRLRTLAGLEHLRSAYGLYLADNPALESIDDLHGLRNVGILSIGGCSRLSDIGALAGLDSCGSFSLYACQVSDLTPLADVVLGGLQLSSTQVSTLPTFSRVSDVNDIGMFANSRLTSCAGLDGMVSLRYLRLSDNSALASLAGFGGLRGLKDVTIDNNASLCMSAIQAWLDTVSVAVEPYIENNGGCR